MKSLSGAKSVNIGIVGYGLVGAKLAEILEERGFPLGDTVRIFANKKSVGKTVQLADRKITIEPAINANYKGLDIVFNTATADFSAENAETICKQGPIFIDSSSARRLDPRVPLLIPEVNPEALDDVKLGIIAKPNCTTTISAMALHYLHIKSGLKSLGVNSYQSTSGQGQLGIDEHEKQAYEMIKRGDELIHGQAKPYPAPAIFPAVTLAKNLNSKTKLAKSLASASNNCLLT